MLGGIAVVVVIVGTVGAVIFKPWLIVVNTEVDDEIPAVASAPPTPGVPSGDAPADAARRLSSGTFISHEHDTSGTASIIENPDGSRIVAIENLRTTTGPDVHVWLSAGPVIPGFSGWTTAGDHPHVDLGMIKGNRGDQVYPIPAGTDLDEYGAVVLWCVQFGVSFGAAELAAA
ncbi:MAG: DM13 domain-containing protein [Gordonia sp. (in: high G+C Gram-positive bacteria)]